MKLFVQPTCPHCTSLKKRLGLEITEPMTKIGPLTIYLVPDDLKPHSEADVEGMAEVDLLEIVVVPTLVDDDGNLITDAFDIYDQLKDIDSPRIVLYKWIKGDSK